MSGGICVWQWPWISDGIDTCSVQTPAPDSVNTRNAAFCGIASDMLLPRPSYPGMRIWTCTLWQQRLPTHDQASVAASTKPTRSIELAGHGRFRARKSSKAAVWTAHAKPLLPYPAYIVYSTRVHKPISQPPRHPQQYVPCCLDLVYSDIG